jgi:phosphotransferase system IIA component
MVLVCYISPRALVSIYAWYSGVVELVMLVFKDLVFKKREFGDGIAAKEEL